MVARVEVQAVVGLAHKATHHSLVEAAPHIPEQQGKLLLTVMLKAPVR